MALLALLSTCSVSRVMNQMMSMQEQLRICPKGEWTPEKMNPAQFEHDWDKDGSRSFNQLKSYGDKKYSGSPIGQRHEWNYTGADENSQFPVWKETKESPLRWGIAFDSIKVRRKAAPELSGCPTGTKYHWLILADQVVQKLDANRYSTHLAGIKLKIAHMRPYWRMWSNQYENSKDNEINSAEIMTWADQYIRGLAQKHPRLTQPEQALEPNLVSEENRYQAEKLRV